MAEPIEKVAEAFDALKKTRRIRTMIMAAEKKMTPGEIADELGMSESGVRNYLKDLRAADLVENGDAHSYTDFGETIRSELELIAFEEDEKWLKDVEKRADIYKHRVQLKQKRGIKQKLKNIV